ncbi:TonB-dependent receptor [Ideonella sp. 4Y11]|uniref:TonB-dependent receptor n=1 Tax=Ideonella aquatica TaxID=2824119 RepID=A0A941BI59_9BURK|nr:TonB-dependent receptor [Ideonella aquatica]MBQ0958257.1 TonB-dependent receptor [Ideonella aquatica]
MYLLPSTSRLASLTPLAAALVALLWSGSVAAQPTPDTPAESPEPARVTVRGQRPYEQGPLPGLLLGRDQLPANVQSADKAELKASRALNIGEFMNLQMPSVSVNDYAGNPFQLDVSYRGFTASPQIGTPQGLSVFLDGVRVNEPFGDVVNWDLLPMNAIERFDVFPGSNPLYGLNTLGGALSLRTRSGFTSPGLDASLQYGSAGRAQAQLAYGWHEESRALFGALTHFEERGWRDNSPSRVDQGFVRGDWRFERGSVGVSLLGASNDLIGNGLIPYESWLQNPRSVFTSPDQSRNRLAQAQLFGTFELDEQINLSAQAYTRHSRRRGLNGDIYEGFDEFDADIDVVRGPLRPRTSPLPACQWLDANRDGRRDTEIIVLPDGTAVDDVLLAPLNDPNNEGLCDTSARRPQLGGARNGQETGAPGVVEGTPIGLLTRTDVAQRTDGLALQMNFNLERHRLMVGASVDASSASYRMAQRLGLIDASHQVYAAPDQIDVQYRAAQVDVRANDFDGRSRTRSLYVSETWTPQPGLHLNLAGRYNHTRVRTRLLARSGFGEEAGALHNLRTGNLRAAYLLCPTADPASCPSEPQPVARPLEQLPDALTRESLRYESLNPSLGFSWRLDPALNLFGNLSAGTRTPSVIELGCAFDARPVNLNAGLIDDATGEAVPPLMRPRSLVGPTCSLPSTLSGDPFLPQIRARSAELGARGLLPANWGPLSRWEWNASAYRTDLRDDIFFVGVSAERSYFDTIGHTRRQGVEMGVKGRHGPFELRFNYAWTDATFQSRFYVLSPHNSSADFDQNSQPSSALPTPTANDNGTAGTYRMIRVDPGARMPGISPHNLNASLSWSVSSAWTLRLSAVAHSRAYVRGNENNAHRPAGTDSETLLYLGGSGTWCDANGYCGGTSGGGRTVGRPFMLPGSTPGYAVFHLMSHWRLPSGLTLTAGVYNLFDRRYFTAGRLGVNPFSPSVLGAIGPSGWNYNSSEWQNTSFVGPAAPRAFVLGVSLELD